MIKEAEGSPREHADAGCQGLTLRVSGMACSWYARAVHDRRQVRVWLGDARIWTLREARQVCIDVRRHIAAGGGEPATEWIEAKRSLHGRGASARRSPSSAATADLPELMPRQTKPETWRFGEARDRWREWLISESGAGAMRPATVRNYLGVMGGPEMRKLDDRHVCSLDATDLARVVQALATQGKRSTARDVVRVAKRMWRWLCDPARIQESGATRKVMDDLVAPRLGTPKVKGTRRFPQASEIAGMLVVASYGIMSDTTGFAVELLCMTAQRRLSIVKARVDEFEPWNEREGWGLWWQGHRKIDRGRPTADDPRHGAHALPLPPVVWDRVQSYLQRCAYTADRNGRPRSPWMFPAARPRRSGDAVGHMSPDTLTHAVAIMPGVQAAPHDVRRAFATVLQRDHKISASQVGMVLDHANSDLLQVVDGNGMTRRYTGDQMLAMKAPALRKWLEVLMAEVRKARAQKPDMQAIKRMMTEANLRQRGVKDVEAERERRKAAAARSWAEGRTSRQLESASGK